MSSTTSGKYIGVIDQRTAGTRFAIIDHSGDIIGVGYEPHTTYTEAPHSVEFDPMEIWQCTRAAFQAALGECAVQPTELAAIGITSQRQTCVLWDADSGKPHMRAVSWQDRRAKPFVDACSPADRTLIQERTGLILDPYFAGPTLGHLLEVDQSLRKAATDGTLRFGTIDSWLLSRLTGKHQTDITNAAQTMLVDIDRGEWDPELLATFDIPRDILPSIHPSSAPSAYGRTDVGGLLDTEIPVTGVIGGQQAALVGHGGFNNGDTKISFGAGNFALQNVGHSRPDGSDAVLSTIWFQEAGEEPYYGLEAPVFTAGTLMEWLDDLGMLQCEGEPYVPTVVSEAADCPRVIPSIAGGGAPNWCSSSGGALFGLTLHDNTESIALAAVDGIAFATRSALEALEDASGHRADQILVDGGGVRDTRVASRQASLLGRDLVRAAVSPTAALGAAVTAGLAVDMWETLQSFTPTIGLCFPADGDPAAIQDLYDEWTALRDQVHESAN